MRKKSFSYPELNLTDSLMATREALFKHLSHQKIGYCLDKTEAAIMDLIRNVEECVR